MAPFYSLLAFTLKNFLRRTQSRFYVVYENGTLKNCKNLQYCPDSPIGQKNMIHLSFYGTYLGYIILIWGLLWFDSNFRFSLKPRDIKIKFDAPFPHVVNVFPIIYYFIKNTTTICIKGRNSKYVCTY